MVKQNIETSHTDMLTLLTSKSSMWILVITKGNVKLSSLMDQRPETHSKCTGENDTSEAL